ncbi:hypothetical protein BH11PLA2_BH11PLA2_09570 [soil metagenome]
MSVIRGVVKNGAIELEEPIGVPMYEGMEVEIRVLPSSTWDSVPDSNQPLTPEEIARQLAILDSIRGQWLEPEAKAAWEKAKAEEREWELANWDKHSKETEDLFK